MRIHKKVCIVGGTFDFAEGKSSKILSNMIMNFTGFTSITTINGGHISILEKFDPTPYDVLIWTPDITNDFEKILPSLKKKNPTMLLVSSKRLDGRNYTMTDMIFRLLNTRSNMGIVIDKQNNRYIFQLIDPLGNEYCNTESVELLTEVLKERLQELLKLHRIPSQKYSDKLNFEINEKFLEFVRFSGTEFTKYVTAINPDRFLGNASVKTRCMFGFPAEKQGNRLFITQRNIDKELIENNGFVEVIPSLSHDTIFYYGDKKPSVDTGIQIKLFQYFNQINYIVHGHIYVEDAYMTDTKIPCGYLDEFEEILKLDIPQYETHFAINLRGHGCLLLSDTVEKLWDMGKYKSRPFLEK